MTMKKRKKIEFTENWLDNSGYLFFGNVLFPPYLREDNVEKNCSDMFGSDDSKIMNMVKDTRLKIIIKTKRFTRLLILTYINSSKNGKTPKEIRDFLKDFAGHNITPRMMSIHLSSLKESELVYVDSSNRYSISIDDIDNDYLERLKKEIKPFRSENLFTLWKIFTLYNIPAGLKEEMDKKEIESVNDVISGEGTKTLKDTVFKSYSWAYWIYRHQLQIIFQYVYDNYHLFDSNFDLHYQKIVSETKLKSYLTRYGKILFSFKKMWENPGTVRSLKYKLEVLLFYAPNPLFFLNSNVSFNIIKENAGREYQTKRILIRILENILETFDEDVKEALSEHFFSEPKFRPKYPLPSF